MTTSTASEAPTAQREFDALIREYSDCREPDAQKRINESVWDRFGARGAVFISDMAGFSSTSRALGICHFLKLIHRTREAIAPIVAANHGQFLKAEADNCYAFFEKTDDAIQASFDVNAELLHANQAAPLEDHIFVSVGIDHGDLLLIGSGEFYGDPVNTASKLGEDLASRGETLVTGRALEHSAFVPPQNSERLLARISEIEISYLRIPMVEAANAKREPRLPST